MLREVLVGIVRLRQVAVPEIDEGKLLTDERMLTSVAFDGTPPHQFKELVQSVLIPSQVPVANPVMDMLVDEIWQPLLLVVVTV